MKYPAYLFDLDGTLIDSMPFWQRAMLISLDEEKIEYPENLLDIICPLGYRGTAEYFANNFHLNATADELVARMYEGAYIEYRDNIPFKAGVRDFLLRMKEKGHSLNVLTASPHLMLDTALKRLGVFELFDNVWSCEDFKTDKTNPEIYLSVARELSVNPSEIAFFDDNINSIKGATRANLYTVGVFDISGRGFEDELKRIADKYVYTFENLEEI